MKRAGGSSVTAVGDDIPDVHVVFVDLNSHVEARLEMIGRLRGRRPELEIVGFSHHAERDCADARALPARRG